MEEPKIEREGGRGVGLIIETCLGIKGNNYIEKMVFL